MVVGSKRNKALLVGVDAVVVVVAVVAVAISAFGNSKNVMDYNVAQVYINSWYVDTNESLSVQFKIYLDLNNDGVFEVERTSEVMNDSAVLVAPFKLGGPINVASRPEPAPAASASQSSSFGQRTPDTGRPGA
jgi:hypothetical protein